jgi:hypothetical protein
LICMFCRSLFVLFLFAIVLSVSLRFTDSDYPFGIFICTLLSSLMTHVTSLKTHVTSIKTYVALLIDQCAVWIYFHTFQTITAGICNSMLAHRKRGHLFKTIDLISPFPKWGHSIISRDIVFILNLFSICAVKLHLLDNFLIFTATDWNIAFLVPLPCFTCCGFGNYL